MSKPNLKKRMTIMIIALVVVFGSIVGFNLFKSYMMKQYFASYESPAVAVTTVKAQQQQWHPALTAVGTFVAINGVDVNSEASGNVVAIHFKSGQYVLKGQPLIQIDDSVDQATLKDNKASLSLKEISYKRQAELFRRGANSSSDVDEAKANLERAQALTEQTTAQINQKHIKAPFSGMLGIRQVNLGQFISPGNTSIVSLQSMDPLFLQFYLPEQQIKNLFVDQTVMFSVDAFPNAVFKAKISALNSKIDINTHNVLLQATLPNCPLSEINNKDSKLVKIEEDKLTGKNIVTCDSKLNEEHKVDRFVFTPGMFANVQVIMPTLNDVVVLPTTAISYSLFGNSVFIVEKDPKKKDKKGNPVLTVKREFVFTGEERGNYVVVDKGVKSGQEVVSSGQLKLHNGTRVVINNSVQLKDVKNPDSMGQ